MRYVLRYGLPVVLLACNNKQPKPPAQVVGGTAVAEVHAASFDTSPDGTVLVTGSDGFIHTQNWTENDSLVGEFFRFAKRHQGVVTVTSDSVALPASIVIGRTSPEMLRRRLGSPSHQTTVADTLVIEYASPFIGPDESVAFQFVSGTLRRIDFSLFEEE